MGQSWQQPTKEQTLNQLTQKIAETKQSISKFDFPQKFVTTKKINEQSLAPPKSRLNPFFLFKKDAWLFHRKNSPSAFGNFFFGKILKISLRKYFRFSGKKFPFWRTKNFTRKKYFCALCNLK
jgi:hypothetical protein